MYIQEKAEITRLRRVFNSLLANLLLLATNPNPSANPQPTTQLTAPPPPWSSRSISSSPISTDSGAAAHPRTKLAAQRAFHGFADLHRWLSGGLSH